MISADILFEDITQEGGYVIGEIAYGHEGSPEKLTQLIKCVADSGCQIIKFKIFKTSERAIEGHKEWDIFSGLELVKVYHPKTSDNFLKFLI